MMTGWDWQIENTLSYTFNIEKHNFDVLVGQSFKKSGFGMGEYLEATANDLLFSDWDRAISAIAWLLSYLSQRISDRG